MSFIVSRLKHFGSAPCIAKHLKSYPATSYLNMDTVQKASKAFAGKKLNDQQIRDTATKVVFNSSIKHRDSQGNAISDLVDALEEFK